MINEVGTSVSNRGLTGILGKEHQLFDIIEQPGDSVELEVLMKSKK